MNTYTKTMTHVACGSARSSSLIRVASHVNLRVVTLAALSLCSAMCTTPDAAAERETPSEPQDLAELPALDLGEEEEDVSFGAGLNLDVEADADDRCGGVAHVGCAPGYVCKLDDEDSSDPMGRCVVAPRDTRLLRGLGERCGGIAGFQCEDDLVCKLDDVGHSDAMGTCVPRGARQPR